MAERLEGLDQGSRTSVPSQKTPFRIGSPTATSREIITQLGGPNWAREQFDFALRNVRLTPLLKAFRSWFDAQQRSGRTYADLATLVHEDVNLIKKLAGLAKQLLEGNETVGKLSTPGVEAVMRLAEKLDLPVWIHPQRAVESEALRYCVADALKQRSIELMDGQIDSVVSEITKRLGLHEDILSHTERLSQWVNVACRSANADHNGVDSIGYYTAVADGCAARVVLPSFVPKIVSLLDRFDSYVCEHDGQNELAAAALHLRDDIGLLCDLKHAFDAAGTDDLTNVAIEFGAENPEIVSQQCRKLALQPSQFESENIGVLLMSSKPMSDTAMQVYEWFQSLDKEAN